MRFTTTHDYECLSEIIALRKIGLIKVSFKDCSMKEGMIGQLTDKVTDKSSIVSDIALQL